jgi:hypothetical protein
MIDSKAILEIYKEYLIQKAFQDGRPFRLPKSDATLLKRTDYKLFCGLHKALQTSKITKKREQKIFMETARLHLKSEFYIGEILQYFDAIHAEYLDTKEPDWSELYKEIKNGYKKIEEYAIINDKRTIESMNIGNPSPLLKMWKSRKVCDVLLVYVIDINTIRNKAWFKVYCGSLNQSLSKIKSIIAHNEEVKHELEKGLVKLNASLKAFAK